MRDGLTRRRVLRAVTISALGTTVIAAGAVSAQYAPAVAGKETQAQAQRVVGEVHPSGWCKNFLQKKQ